MGAQTIVTPHGERLVIISEAEYEALVAAAEDAEDAEAFAAFQSRLDAGEEELVPSDVVNRILGGENRVRVWREHRGLSASALAEKASIAQGFLSQIETGKRDGTAETLLKIASVLRLPVEDLIEPKVVRIERLIHRRPGLTVEELAKEANASESQTRKHCEGLCHEGRVLSKENPVRFFPSEMP